MAKSYVKFEVPKDIADKSLEALRLAKQSGSVRKGVNEVTKSIERGLASLVLIAGDVEPEEVVIHLPTLCEQKKIPVVYIAAKADLGKAAGLNVPCTAASIEKAGEGQARLKEVTMWLSSKSAPKQETSKPGPKQETSKPGPKQETSKPGPKQETKEKK